MTTAQRFTLIAAILASSMGFLDFSALGVVLPSLQNDLHASGTQLLWISNMSPLILSAFMLVGGSLGDRLGRKKIFMTGIALFGGGSLLSGLAPSVTLLIAARAVQGLGGALMIPGSLAMITSVFTSENRGKAIGTWSALSTVATAVGPIIAGFLAKAHLWRGMFFIAPVFGVIALTILAKFAPESKNPNASQKLDWAGTFLGTIGLAGITYGFTEAPRLGFTNGTILGSLIGGLVALVLFVLVESKSKSPLFPLSLFHNRTFSGTNLLTLLLYGSLSGIFFFVPLNLIQIQGYSPAVVGFTFLPFVVMLATLSRFTGAWADRIGARLPLTLGPIVVALGMALLAVPGITHGAGDYWTTFFPAILCIGIGMSIVVAPLSTAVMGSAPTDHAGSASGINNAVSRSAGVLFIAVMGALALSLFTNTLTTKAGTENLSASAQMELKTEAAKFGDAQVPANLSQEQTTQVRTDIQNAFVHAFRITALLMALGAFLSGLVAFFTVEKKQRAEVA